MRAEGKTAVTLALVVSDRGELKGDARGGVLEPFVPRQQPPGAELQVVRPWMLDKDVAVVVKTVFGIPFWLVGEFTTHLRTCLVVGLGCSLGVRFGF